MTCQEISRSRFFQRHWQCGTRVFVSKNLDAPKVVDLRTQGALGDFDEAEYFEVKPGEYFAWLDMGTGKIVVEGCQ